MSSRSRQSSERKSSSLRRRGVNPPLPLGDRHVLTPELVASLIMNRELILDRPPCRMCSHGTRLVGRTYMREDGRNFEERTFECFFCGHSQIVRRLL